MPATLQGLSNNDGPLNGEENRKFTSSVRIGFSDHMDDGLHVYHLENAHPTSNDVIVG